MILQQTLNINYAVETDFDEANLYKLPAPPESFGSEESMEFGIQMKEMMEKLKSLEDPTLFLIANILNQEHEIEVIRDSIKTLQDQLHLDDDRIRAYAVEYLTYYRTYIG